MDHDSGAKSVRTTFQRLFPGEPRMFRAPGRINIIGEHTDYNGGLVMPATVDLYTWAAGAPRDDRCLQVHLCADGQTQLINIDNIEPGARGDSVEYIKAVVWALSEYGVNLTGCDVVIDGNIPLGGGLSSSASLALVLAAALLEFSGLSLPPGELAGICQRAESEFVGVSCGIMDQFIIECGVSGHAMVLDCRSLEFDTVPLPSGVSFMVAHCGIERRLPAGSYNARREECERAVTLLKPVWPNLECLGDIGTDELLAHRNRLDELSFRRARHVVGEIDRVRQARAAIEHAEMGRLGELISQSHDSLRDDFEVSCKELDQLVELTLACDGALGSRVMGAGFGGCTISLVKAEQAAEVAQKVGHEYGKVLGQAPWIHIVGPADAVKSLDWP